MQRKALAYDNRGPAVTGDAYSQTEDRSAQWMEL